MVAEQTLVMKIQAKLYQLDMLQAYFEKMALKGWEIKEIGDLQCIFGKAEPKATKYSVVYFKYSHKTDAEEAEFLKSCDELGWKFVDHNKNIYVFKANTDFPTPIKVDKKEQRKEVIAYLFGNGRDLQ